AKLMLCDVCGMALLSHFPAAAIQIVVWIRKKRRTQMALRGRVFLPMWSGLLPGYERELDRWHTIEHMPERLGGSGVLRGRRYMERKVANQGMFILYEGAHIETFRSPGLLARLNDPTEWSKRVQPGLVNFIRGACQTLISLGDGVGGAVIAMRVS